jgi:hypothetical protein
MIKHYFLIGCLIFILILPSCASLNKTSDVDPNYEAYQQAMIKQINKEQKPLIDLQIGDDGKIKGIKMYPEQKFINLLPYSPKPHPVWRVINTAVTGVATVFGIREGGKALERVIDASTGDTSYTDSYNDMSNRSVNTESNSDSSSTTDNNLVNTEDNSVTTDYSSVESGVIP